MIVTDDQVFGFYPHAYLQYRPSLARFPGIFNLTGDSVVGNGGGYGKEAVYGGWGEYIERYHFYNEVEVDVTEKLTLMNPREISEKLFAVIQQIKNTDMAVEDHPFNLTCVRNILNNETVYLPTTLFSLAHADSSDRYFIPFIDSCGQAAHITAEKALVAALNEFIERQALVGAWLSGKARFQIDLHTHHELNSLNHILLSLQSHGELYAYEVNNCLPGYTIILFYFSKNKKDIVAYSVGMASDCIPLKALARAINELWQSYIFMYFNADNSEQLDQRYQYLNELIQFNHPATRDIIPFIGRNYANVSVDDLAKMESFTQQQALSQLAEISSAVYSYERHADFLGGRFYFCKVLSPDFFIHMGIKMPLNKNNLYANLLHIDPLVTIKHPIPFP